MVEKIYFRKLEKGKGAPRRALPRDPDMVNPALLVIEEPYKQRHCLLLLAICSAILKPYFSQDLKDDLQVQSTVFTYLSDQLSNYK